MGRGAEAPGCSEGARWFPLHLRVLAVPLPCNRVPLFLSPPPQTGCISCASGDGRFGGPIWWNTPVDEAEEETAEQNRATWGQAGAEEEAGESCWATSLWGGCPGGVGRWCFLGVQVAGGGCKKPAQQRRPAAGKRGRAASAAACGARVPPARPAHVWLACCAGPSAGPAAAVSRKRQYEDEEEELDDDVKKRLAALRGQG